MSVFKRVSMKDVVKYRETPEVFKGMRCQLNVTGPQFYEAKGHKAKGVKKNDTV